MIERLGIIPAAGKAGRFGGVMKELLPVKDNLVMMDCAYHALKDMPVLIVTNLVKLPALAAYFPNATFRLQNGNKDAWSAIEQSFGMCALRNFYAMPDTIFNMNAFDIYFPYDFTVGYFHTDQPQRYGMLRDTGIVDKQSGEPGDAWGVVVWSDRVVKLWQDRYNEIETHTQAFNMAIERFGLHKFPLQYYYDCADMQSYREILSHV